MFGSPEGLQGYKFVGRSQLNGFKVSKCYIINLSAYGAQSNG